MSRRRLPSAAQRDRQRGETSKGEVGSPDQRPRLELEARESAYEGLQGDLALDPRERRAEAKVRGPAEGEMAVVGAPEIEAIRVGESLGIAVGGADHGKHGLPLANQLAAEL